MLSVRRTDGAPVAGVEVTVRAPRDSLRPAESTVHVCRWATPCFGFLVPTPTGIIDGASMLCLSPINATTAGRHRFRIVALIASALNSLVLALCTGGAALIVALAGRQPVELGAALTLAGTICCRHGSDLAVCPAQSTEFDGSVLEQNDVSGGARAVGLGNQTVSSPAGDLTAIARAEVIRRGRLLVSTPNTAFSQGTPTGLSCNASRRRRDLATT
jgi:hypothetical protein